MLPAGRRRFFAEKPRFFKLFNLFDTLFVPLFRLIKPAKYYIIGLCFYVNSKNYKSKAGQNRKMKNFGFEYYKKSADYILSVISEKPEIAIVLGSSLGSLADEIEDKTVIDYKDIPNFLTTTVESHAGKMIFGRLRGKRVVAMSGRFHYYEGYEFSELAAPVRVLSLIGVKTTILTNAAGAINTDYRVGDVMIISDHIKLTAQSPLRGKNIDEFGVRFFDVSEMYTPALRRLAKDCAQKIGQSDRVREGVYFFFAGPQFETPAEIRAARILGGDAVGMSTITEALTAAHCGMNLLGLSLMTNMAAGVLDRPVTGEEVSVAAHAASERFKKLLSEIISEI